MKASPRNVLRLTPWISLSQALRGAQDVVSDSILSESAMNIIRAAGAASTCDWFRQPIDHKDPDRGTWSQIYCVNPEWWTPGAPVRLDCRLAESFDC